MNYLFRGLDYNGNWHERGLAFNLRKIDFLDVIISHVTIGQWTGLIDKNGIRIFEGDIVKHYNKSLFVVKFNCGCFEIKSPKNINHGLYFCDLDGCDLEVIGNIHQNSELLK